MPTNALAYNGHRAGGATTIALHSLNALHFDCGDVLSIAPIHSGAASGELDKLGASSQWYDERIVRLSACARQDTLLLMPPVRPCG
jgi:hypothetical protein